MSLAELEGLMPVLTAPGHPDFALEMPDARESFDGMLAGLPVPEDLAFQAGDCGGVPGVWGDSAAARQDRVVLYLHGGAYIAGTAQGYRGLWGRIAQAAGARAFAADYRLGPESVHPAAVEDAVAAYRGLLDQGFAPERIAVAGDSAGGGLSVALLVALRDRGIALPACAALMSPWADLTGASATISSKAAVDPLLTPAGLAAGAARYLGATPATEPTASPVLADLAGLPPILIEVGTREILLADSTTLGARVAEAGGTITVHAWEGMVHDFPLLWFAVAEAREAIAELGAFIAGKLG